MANDERDHLTNFELQNNHQEILLVQKIMMFLSASADELTG
jgi:hypothetical protein